MGVLSSNPAPHLSPTSIPVSSDLSYHNKGKKKKIFEGCDTEDWSNDAEN